MDRTHQLATLLADGAAHTGAALCAAMGCDGTQLEACRDALVAAGLGVSRSNAGDLRVAQPFEPLTTAGILAAVQPAARPARLEVVGVVGSTNAVLLDADPERYASGTALVAEAQSAGRGRSGRRWHSPYGINVYVSLVFDWARPLLDLQGVTPALGVAIARGLGGLGAQRLAVKWPNDLLHDGRKLAGMLVETTSRSPQQHRVVAGFGINVGMVDATPSEVDQPWASLREACANATGGTTGGGRDLSRNAVAAAVIGAVVDGMRRYEASGLAAFAADWASLDYFAGRAVSLRFGERVTRGIAHGIDDRGRLRLATPHGEVAVAAGEVSLRGVD